MPGAEQVIERIDESALPSVSPAPSSHAQPHTGARDPGAVGDNPQADGGFSPDPARRTDRYRLVTPYCLRL